MLSADNGHINDEIISKLVSRITPVDNTNFEWIINLGEEKSEKIRCTLTGRKNSAELTIGDGESCHFTYWLINLLGLNSEIVIKARAGELLHRQLLVIGINQKIAIQWDFPITYEMARAYQKANGKYLRQNQWEDITLVMSLELGK